MRARILCAVSVQTQGMVSDHKALGLRDGLLHDMHMTVDNKDQIDAAYRAAVAGVGAVRQS